MSIKEDLKKIATIEECSRYLSGTLKSFTTIYSKVYSDYENRDFTKQIKAYQRNNLYLVTVSNIEDKCVKELTVCLTNHKPNEPHPVFPILDSYAPHSLVYKYNK